MDEHTQAALDRLDDEAMEHERFWHAWKVDQAERRAQRRVSQTKGG
jgi:hypothetical protein